MSLASRWHDQGRAEGMVTGIEQCWICKQEAKTGEHLIKASDLRDLFGKISQKCPVFLHRDDERNLRINTIRSCELKSNALLCENCNTSRTSPHDKAWEILSHYLRNRDDLKVGLHVRMNKPFPSNVKEHMLSVHLYFAKLFGCLILDGKIPIDIEPFRRAILDGKPHPNLHIAICYQPDLGSGFTNIEMSTNSRVVFVTWMYLVMPIAVNVMYAEPDQHRIGLNGSWHPSKFIKRIQIMGVGRHN